MDDVTTPEALPGILAEIARLTSVDVAIAVARWKGGGEMYIPTEPGLKHDHELVKIVGRRAALRIVRRWTHGYIHVPSAKTYLNWLDAREMRRKGLTVAQIAAKLKLSRRRVHSLVAGVEAVAATVDTKQADRCMVCGHKHRSGSSHLKTDPRQMELL